jgi:hypothetical protein
MLYIACPYSHRDAAVRNHRYRMACCAAAMLIKHRIVVFRPLPHSVPVAQIGGISETDTDVWLEQDLPFLRCCDEVLVLGLPGWKESIGVRAEIAEAMSFEKPVSIISESDIDNLPEIPATAAYYLKSSILNDSNAERND